MKSQVSALLHVVRGLHKDVLAAYPALEGDLSKDLERLALYCQTRGLGLFTLDLPQLESLLLRGLESGSLVLEGPISHRVSKRIKVPRLYSGLWLLVFDNDATLRQDVDPTALFFLRQLLTIGKRLELECSYDRRQTVVGAYHAIERQLRIPGLAWGDDSLYESSDVTKPDSGNHPEFVFERADYHCGHLDYSDNLHTTRLLDLVPQEGTDQQRVGKPANVEGFVRKLESMNLVQARDYCEEGLSLSLPLFSERRVVEEREIVSRKEDDNLLRQIQRVADLLTTSMDILNPILFSEEMEESGRGVGFRHGRGAVAERIKNWEKSQFVNWPHKLERLFPFELCGKTIGSDERRPLNHESPSRLLCVPKTAKGPRLIAAEPASHMWCQQLILSWFEGQFKKLFGGSFIDLNDQTKSHDLVKSSSLDGSLATVDLSDASDRLSCWTVERIFRGNPSILFALHAARTRYLRDEVSEVPNFLTLRKFASQGTAVTFPVMSFTMLCIALGSCLEGRVTWKNIRALRQSVRVYGDDIIIPSSRYERLVRAMDLLQLKVNTAKSYVNGKFRESCGSDAYLGYDVTPVKPRVIVADSPASCQAVVDTSNNLYMKGLWYASAACFELLPARLRRGIRIVGPNDAGFRGITSYSGGDESHLIKRWNSRLHRYEVRVWTLSVRTQEYRRDGFSALLDFFARKYSTEHARTVSEYADVRKTRIGLQWEPQNTDARVVP